MENELQILENEATKLQNKIDGSKDYFLIYGWSRKLDEVKKKIEKLKDSKTQEEKHHCSWCDKEIDTYYWENLVKGFCSLECTNEYLESEGFTTISGPHESAKVNPKYL